MFVIHPSCKIDPSASINVNNGFLGAGSIIRPNVVIEGENVEIGREAFIDRNATIGGGSCYDPNAFLTAGDWFHMGINSQVNIARGVKIGHEVGVGIDTKIFTHGAYIDSFNLGAPVQWEGVEIGDNVWLPNAWVNPGVKIGCNVVVAARSLVVSELPDGCLAGGTPAKVLKDGFLPKTLTISEKDHWARQILKQINLRLLECSYTYELMFNQSLNAIELRMGDFHTVFDLSQKTVSGDVSEPAIIIKDQLRRNGVRFRYEVVDGKWRAWDSRHNLTDAEIKD